VAAYIAAHGPNDTVLYDGYDDGLFGFYFRALDPGFHRRLILGQQLLYHYGPAATFDWVQTQAAESVPELLALLQRKCDCRWIAIEMGPSSVWAKGQRLLREAVKGPGFELVHSFPVVAPNAERVDLYRLLGRLTPVQAIDVRITSFTERVYSGVVPVGRRP
jgi:hypothetical protein